MKNRRLRSKSKKRGSSRYFALAIAILLVLFLLYLGVKEVLTKWEVFKIEKIEITGFVDIEEDFLLNRCTDLVGENLFSVSSDDITKRFSNIIRVKKVKIGRHLPDKLKINIEERKAYIQAKSKSGALYPLDIEKRVLDTDRFYGGDITTLVSTGLSDADFVVGEVLSDSLLNRIYSLIEQVYSYKADFIHRVSEIYECDDDLVLVEVNRGYKIYLGDEDIHDKLEQYEFIATNREIEAGFIVDLRFTDKLIIRSED